jgi:hypothetical protein
MDRRAPLVVVDVFGAAVLDVVGEVAPDRTGDGAENVDTPKTDAEPWDTLNVETLGGRLSVVLADVVTDVAPTADVVLATDVVAGVTFDVVAGAEADVVATGDEDVTLDAATEVTVDVAGTGVLETEDVDVDDEVDDAEQAVDVESAPAELPEIATLIVNLGLKISGQ